MIAAQLNLEPGVFGQCYLVPFKGTCQLIPGWIGWTDLFPGLAGHRFGRAKSGKVMNLMPLLASKPFVHHKPDFDGDEDRLYFIPIAVGKQTGASIL